MKKILSFIIISAAFLGMYFLNFYFSSASAGSKLHIIQSKIEDNKKSLQSKTDNKSVDGKSQKIKNIEEKALAFIGDKEDNVALVYYDLNTGNGMSINGDKKFVAASTIKIPMNMVLFDMVNKKQISLDKKVQYIEKYDYAEGTGKLDGSDLTSPISLQTLSELSIVNSDNIATNMIKRTISEDKLFSYYEKMLGHKVDKENNTIAANDLAKFLKILYNNPEHNKYYNMLVDYMKNTEFHDRMDKYIPKEIVAHKIGSYESYINDAGIVYTENPYILVIFTNEIENADDFIAQLSEIIYDEVIDKN